MVLIIDKIKRAFDLAMAEIKKSHGDDYRLEEGDEFAFVFNDGVLIISNDSSELHIKFLLGEPCVINHNLDLIEVTSE